MEAIDKWHKTKLGHLAFGLAELVLSYVFISLAIDSAHFWQYVLALLLFVGGIRNLFKAIWHRA